MGDVEKIKDYLIEKEEIKEPIIFPVTIIVSIIRFDPKINTIEEIFEGIIREIETVYNFRLKEKKTLREGFLKPLTRGQTTIEVIYCKETPSKIDLANSDKLETFYFKTVDPPFRVKVIFNIFDNHVEIRIFGGKDILAFNVRNISQIIVRKYTQPPFTTINKEFSKEDMFKILDNFGENVEFINIDPRDNEKFRKVVEEIGNEGKIEKVIYDVQNVKMRGYKISLSPQVKKLLQESGIYLREILGKLRIGDRKYITTKVTSSGRILFYIPLNFLEDEDVYEYASSLFDTLINFEIKPSGQTSISNFGGKYEN